MSTYHYNIIFRSTNAHGNADGLSHLPLSVTEDESSLSEGASAKFNLAQIVALPVMCTELQTVTRNDPIMSKVLHYTRYGWPAETSKDLKPYYHWSNELTIESNCVMCRIRVVVPKKLKARVLEELHISHMGMNKMKLVARGFVRWLSIDKEIEQLAKSCDACLSVRHAPSRSPLHPWSWPSQPWQHVHVDFAGPLFSKTYLLVVDSYSKWLEIWEVSSTSTTATIEVLRHIFSVLTYLNSWCLIMARSLPLMSLLFFFVATALNISSQPHITRQQMVL